MTRDCDICGTAYEAKRSTSRYCSGRCRTTATRKGQARPKATVIALRPAEDVDAPGPIEAATLRELSSVDRQGSATGQRALMLARLLDNPPPMTLSSVAGWSREHGASLAAALVNTETPAATSALDRARERRNAKHA